MQLEGATELETRLYHLAREVEGIGCSVPLTRINLALSDAAAELQRLRAILDSRMSGRDWATITEALAERRRHFAETAMYIAQLWADECEDKQGQLKAAHERAAEFLRVMHSVCRQRATRE